MSNTIQTSVLDSLPVIAFKNNSTGEVEVLICETSSVMRMEVDRMEKMDHIELLKVGNAAIKRS